MPKEEKRTEIHLNTKQIDIFQYLQNGTWIV